MELMCETQLHEHEGVESEELETVGQLTSSQGGGVMSPFAHRCLLLFRVMTSLS
jgi:hypothetical protein